MKGIFQQKGRPFCKESSIGRGKALILVFFAVLASIYIVFAVTDTITSFYDQSNPFDVNFTSAGNMTYYIDVPMYAYVTNITVSLNGMESS